MNSSFQEKGMKLMGMVSVVLLALLSTLACSQRQTVSYGDTVKKALEQADLKDVTVTEDRDKNTITLGGKLHSEDAKQQAGQIAQAAAGNRIIVNQISVEPVGNETAAKRVESNVDDGIENNYKAALISKGLDKEHIRFDAKNGVLVLKGSVKTPNQRKEAEQVADNVPNVAQVVNEIQVRR
jgi:hyperosmotically inducible periplasmic protein